MNRYRWVLGTATLAWLLGCSSHDDTSSTTSGGSDGDAGTGGAATSGGATSSGGAASGGAVSAGGMGSGGSSVTTGGTSSGGTSGSSATFVDLPLTTYVDKLEGGWIAQMAAGRWMANMEFNYTYTNTIAPESALVAWTPDQINHAFGNEGDETWAEIPYLDSLYVNGPKASWIDFGNSWRDSGFPDAVLYSANLMARNNLKGGMQAPESGYFTNTGGNAENQTWQMESNWTGMLAPGMVNVALDINWRAGHVALFGDALNGGAMITAMQSKAFFAESLDEIIQAGRVAVPEGSRYREMIEDVLAWHAEDPDDYGKVWQLIEDKWFSANHLDTKINGAMILLGLLFGNGNFEDTVKLTGRAGWDGDCTANDAGSIIGTWLGLSGLDPTYSSALDSAATFVGTDYTFQTVIDHSTEVARSIVQYAGGSVNGTGDSEVWSIPVEGSIVPPILEQWPIGQDATPPAMTDISLQIEDRDVNFSVSATSASGILVYQWYFGDLTHSAASSDAVSTHTFAQAGDYYVIAYVADTTGNTSWKATTVTLE